nr:MAG TPA: hypothetical protein [Caudoviricetes sp.]
MNQRQIFALTVTRRAAVVRGLKLIRQQTGQDLHLFPDGRQKKSC